MIEVVVVVTFWAALFVAAIAAVDRDGEDDHD